MSELPYRLAWYGCDLRTGGIVEDLRALKPTGALTRKLGDATTLQFELALSGAPSGWEEATVPGQSAYVAVDTATDTPIWAGVALTRASGSTQTVQLGAATLERYLDSRYPGTQTLLATDQAAVVSALVTPALTAGPPITLDAPGTGVTMNYLTQDGDDKTILSCLKELMGLEGGPEWTIDVTWNSDHSGFQFPLRVRSAIGTQVATPEGTFDFPGCVSNYTLTESYEDGKGATVVTARGEGEGSSRLTSAAHEATALLAAGWPRWEYRYTPAAGVTDPDQLEAHATQSLALMQQGAQVWNIEAVASRAPRLGRDWSLGDTVRLAVEHSPRHPQGTDIAARCWSWELDPGADRVRPIIVEEG
ncbi:hypothetical protein [Streptomyces natalensis]|uniref:Uncharacterized protein n=1 Tax=Streptomyces natalensis ATCC 27448 TaxID=1240678 RepID=A0A0D7CL75_9ACTN|nr:hypothetical protein [Streptomyces natalensis]KIZ16826.1 hypothetical protein SNA_17655 [Streptomyces natalensis ATCC 27448]